MEYLRRWSASGCNPSRSLLLPLLQSRSWTKSFPLCSEVSWSTSIITALGGGLSIFNSCSFFLAASFLSSGRSFLACVIPVANLSNQASEAWRWSKRTWSTCGRYRSFDAILFITTFKLSGWDGVSRSTLSRKVILRNTSVSFSVRFLGGLVSFWGRSHILSCVPLARSKRCGLTRSGGRSWYNSRYKCDVEKPWGDSDSSFLSTLLRCAVKDPALSGDGALSLGPTEVRSSNFDLPLCSRVKALSAKQQSRMRSWSQEGKRRQARTSSKNAVGSPSRLAVHFLWYQDC